MIGARKGGSGSQLCVSMAGPDGRAFGLVLEIGWFALIDYDYRI